jgi:hypothetical protein
MLIELTELYKNNAEFKTYVDKYARAHGLLIENALKCATVRSYAEYVKEKQND